MSGKFKILCHNLPYYSYIYPGKNQKQQISICISTYIFQFNSLITVTIRSQCTKEVDKAEIGRIFSVVGLFQALVPLIANPLFGFIYKSTLNTLPGAYLLTIVGMLIFVLVTSLIMTLHTHRREQLCLIPSTYYYLSTYLKIRFDGSVMGRLSIMDSRCH